MLRPFAKRPALDLQHDDRGVPRPTATASSSTSPTPPRWRGERSTTAGTSLFEGAQGALLDIDHGTYPFVTSSNPVAGAACVGAGVGPQATSTRSGASPRRTPRASAPGRSRPSCTTRSASEIRQRGGEFGTTTGRPRRTGWLDLVALRYAARLNRLTGARRHQARRALSGFDTHPGRARATAAREDAGFDDVPLPPVGPAPRAAASTRSCRAGARTSRECRTPTDLPQAARDYLRYIAERRRRARSSLVGVGPGPRAGRVDRCGPRAARARAAGAPEAGGQPAAPSSTAASPRRSSRSASATAEHRASAAKRDLHADDALLGPVDVVELEQQRGLVERQRHAGAERQRQPRVAAARRATTTAPPPASEGQHDARDEVVDVAVAERPVAKRPERPVAADRRASSRA